MPRNPNAGRRLFGLVAERSSGWRRPWGARPYRRPSCPSSAAAVERLYLRRRPSWPLLRSAGAVGGRVRVNVDRRGGCVALGGVLVDAARGRAGDAAAGAAAEASKVSALREFQVAVIQNKPAWVGGRRCVGGPAANLAADSAAGLSTPVRSSSASKCVTRPSWRDPVLHLDAPRQDQLRLAAATVVTAGARGDVQADQGTTPPWKDSADTGVEGRN